MDDQGVEPPIQQTRKVHQEKLMQQFLSYLTSDI